jgi:uncharacterized protein YjbI with pentapeptide repeats
MDRLAIRTTSAALPRLDEADLEEVDSLTNRLGVISDFRVDDLELRALTVADQSLVSGRIHGLRAERAKLREVRMDSVEFAGCDLSRMVVTDGKWSRVHFVNCKILSGEFEDVTFENVVFDRCKLDYASFQSVTAKGPVIFRECSLEEAWFSGCDLSKAAFDDCRMVATAFERTTAEGMDLRGNDLSALRGIASLRHALVERSQTLELGWALVGDLELELPEDVDEDKKSDGQPG